MAVVTNISYSSWMDGMDEITSVWPDQICHNQVLSLVKVVIPFLERMNLKEPIYEALSGLKIPTVHT